MEKSIKHFATVLPIGVFQTATPERGNELACAQKIESELEILFTL